MATKASALAFHHALTALAEDLTWFLACPEIRVLHIATSTTERPLVVTQVALSEGHGHNRSNFFVLEDAHTKDDDGWMARARQIAAIHEQHTARWAASGVSLHPILPVTKGKRDLVEAGWQLKQCLEAQRDVAELDGLVVVLAPSVLEKAKAFVKDIELLLQTPSLAPVRYIVVEVGKELALPLEKSFGKAVMCTECIVDPRQSSQEQNAMLAAAAVAPKGASPEASAGFAAPNEDMVAPPCCGKPARGSALSAEQKELLTKETGPSTALGGEAGELVRQRVAGAALAAREGRYRDAIALQNEALEPCREDVQYACILELILAAYQFSAGDRDEARETFADVVSRSEAAGLAAIAVQAHFGLAAMHAIKKDFRRSVSHYARAGVLAKEGQSPTLAIEAYRAAGQDALRGHAKKAAVIAWRNALAVADEAAAEAVKHSSAATVARALAKALRKGGSVDEADCLVAQADEYETGVRKTPEVTPTKAEPSDSEPSDVSE
jgi:tetratricopeptide (TPR) repeat protein